MRTLVAVIVAVSAVAACGSSTEEGDSPPSSLDVAAQERLDGFSIVAAVLGVELDDEVVACLASEGVLTADVSEVAVSDVAIVGLTRCDPDTVEQRLIANIEDNNPEATPEQRDAVRCVVGEGIRITNDVTVEENLAELRLPLAERNAKREAALEAACPGSDVLLDQLNA